jgi:AcrR family transcriptional regulator
VTQRTSGGLEPGGWGPGALRRRDAGGKTPALRRREDSSSDRVTRERLIASAARLFGERGFKRVTVREICGAACANVAAVNYHFGDKLGLYREVLQVAVSEMRSTSDAARLAGEGGTSEDKLRAYIAVYIQRVVGSAHDSWIHQLMSRELADPTPALDLVVQQVIRPRLLRAGGRATGLSRRGSACRALCAQHSSPVRRVDSQSGGSAAVSGLQNDASGPGRARRAHRGVLARRHPRDAAVVRPPRAPTIMIASNEFAPGTATQPVARRGW